MRFRLCTFASDENVSGFWFLDQSCSKLFSRLGGTKLFKGSRLFSHALVKSHSNTFV